jgi:hypothetical protein
MYFRQAEIGEKSQRFITRVGIGVEVTNERQKIDHSRAGMNNHRRGSCILAESDYGGLMAETLSIKVPKETKTRLRSLARIRQTSASSLLREALEQVLSGSHPRSKRPSLHALASDLFEDLGPGGPADLSTNPKHLKGFGR